CSKLSIAFCLPKCHRPASRFVRWPKAKEVRQGHLGYIVAGAVRPGCRPKLEASGVILVSSLAQTCLRGGSNENQPLRHESGGRAFDIFALHFRRVLSELSRQDPGPCF